MKLTFIRFEENMKGDKDSILVFKSNTIGFFKISLWNLNRHSDQLLLINNHPFSVGYIRDLIMEQYPEVLL